MKMQVYLTPFENVNLQLRTLHDHSKVTVRTLNYNDKVLATYSPHIQDAHEISVSSLSTYENLIFENGVYYKILSALSKSDFEMTKNPEVLNVMNIIKGLPTTTDRIKNTFYIHKNFVVIEDNDSFYFMSKKENQIGNIHRIDGPAIIRKLISENDKNTFFIDGEMISEKEFDTHPKVLEYRSKMDLKEKVSGL